MKQQGSKYEITYTHVLKRDKYNKECASTGANAKKCRKELSANQPNLLKIAQKIERLRRKKRSLKKKFVRGMSPKARKMLLAQNEEYDKKIIELLKSRFGNPQKPKLHQPQPSIPVLTNDIKPFPVGINETLKDPSIKPEMMLMASQFSADNWSYKGAGIESVAYNASGTKSPMLKSFENDNGAEIFMVQSNGSEEKPRTSNYLQTIMDMSVISKLFELKGPFTTEIRNHSNGTKVLHHDCIGNGNGKTLFSKQGISTRFSNAYIPIKYKNGTYGTLVASYRGPENDKKGYRDFEQYVDTLELPEGVEPLV